MKETIISTLAHYEAERGTPLSAFEIYKYLHKQNNKNPSFKNMLTELKKLKNAKIIKEEKGFYFLSSSENKNHFAKRITNEKISIQKWKKAKKIIYFMQFLPFIKSISIAGSLSMNNTLKKSDIDFFILTKEGRIWTARTLSMILTQMLGQRRHHKQINNKICLNYFISENSLPQIQNIASANIFLRTIPIFGKKIYDNFYKKNNFWIKQYFQKTQENFKIESLRSIKKNNFLLFIKKFLESILSKKIGNLIEKYLALWQKKRIEEKIKEKQNITNLIFTNNILMFHWPKPRNKEVLEKYKLIIKNNNLKI